MTDLIRTLRSLNVRVLHPRVSDAEDLIQQINRIGCSVETIWPAPDTLPPSVDVVFVEIKESISPALTRLLSPRPDLPTVIGLIAYENPSVLAGILELELQAVISKPLRAFGVMSTILMARRVWERQRESSKAEEKMRLKLEQVQTITEAKFILMRHHKISEQDAYKVIRSQAMARRLSTAEIALAIINADGLLNNLKIK
jgi:AmiR/NasT family two-component response regulator